MSMHIQSSEKKKDFLSIRHMIFDLIFDKKKAKI